MGATTGLREQAGLGEVFDYGRRAPVRRSLVEDKGEALRPSLAAVLGRGALRRSGMGQGIVAQKEDRPPPPGIIDEVYRDKRTGQRVSAERETAVEGIVRILQEKAKSQPTVIDVGSEAKPGTQGGRPEPRSPKTGQPGTHGGDVLRRTDPKRSGQTGTQSGDVATEREKPKQNPPEEFPSAIIPSIPTMVKIGKKVVPIGRLINALEAFRIILENLDREKGERK